MTMDPKANWEAELEKLPPVGDGSWAANFAKWTADRISKGRAVDSIGITPDPSKLSDPGFLFTFAEPVFVAQLSLATPSGDAISAIQKFADAWEKAILASIPLVLPGAIASPPPAPANGIFSVVISTIIEPPSIAKGKSILMNLASDNHQPKSKFPQRFLEAFQALALTVVGIDTTPSPAGPYPMNITGVPLI